MFADSVSTGVEGEPFEAVGEITIGQFCKTFRMSLSFWSTDDYRRSWERALRALTCDERAVSCLISSITDPESSNFIFCWPLYREGEVVYVQNSLMFLDKLSRRFDPEEPWRSVDSRQVSDEDGNRISEWTTGIGELRQFLDSET